MPDRKGNALRSIFAIHCAGLLASSAQEAKSPEDIWREVSPSILSISAKGIDGTQAVGSGFVVELEGKRLVLTNRHVVKGLNFLQRSSPVYS